MTRSAGGRGQTTRTWRARTSKWPSLAREHDMIGIANYLGPATVTRIDGRPGCVEVRFPAMGRAWARLAFSVARQPAEGDELLVIGQEADDFYAIGVLRAAGGTTLKIQGDLTLEAGGSLRLEAAKAIEVRSGESVTLRAPEVALRAGRLELAARRVVQRFQDAYLWLTGLFQLKSRRLRAVSEEGLLIKSGRTHLKSA